MPPLPAAGFLGQWELLRSWGRIGQSPTLAVQEPIDSPEAARKIRMAVHKTRQRHGYQRQSVHAARDENSRNAKHGLHIPGENAPSERTVPCAQYSERLWIIHGVASTKIIAIENLFCDRIRWSIAPRRILINGPSARVRQLISQPIDIIDNDFKMLHYNSVNC